MPKYFSTWDQIARAPTYLKAFTIGVPDTMKGGRTYHQGVHEVYKNLDKQYEQKYNSYSLTYPKFAAQWADAKGDELADSSGIAHLVIGYFQNNQEGKVCIVKSKDDRKPERVEIRSPHGDWVTIWSR